MSMNSIPKTTRKTAQSNVGRTAFALGLFVEFAAVMFALTLTNVLGVPVMSAFIIPGIVLITIALFRQ